MAEQIEGLYYYRPPRARTDETIDADLIIYGGTSAGVVAALQASRMGLTVAIAEITSRLGGMSAGGLGATDIGNKAAIGGISRSFYRAMGKHYGHDESWGFEPHVAEGVFQDWVAESGAAVRFRQYLTDVTVESGLIRQLKMDNGTTYRGRAFIDATYEGDLLARAGVSFHAGREPNARYHETLNGIHFGHPNHAFYRWVDAYNVPGKPDTGLLPCVSDDEPGTPGDGDACIQAFNFRLALTDDRSRQLPWPTPASYAPSRYELLLRYIQAGVWDALDLNKGLANGVTDLNNNGAFSTDHIGANHDWPLADWARREEIFQDHVAYQAGLHRFLCTDDRLPEFVREHANKWGLCKDEFTETAGWPEQLYIRESRRMVSNIVMSEKHCRREETVDDPIGMAAYQMDSHNCRRLVLNGQAVNEGNVEVRPDRPYPISYRAIVPRGEECMNLLVPVCVSASHIAFGSIRMEPVFMLLGQSAATAAAMALDADVPVQEVDYAKLRERLLADGQVLQHDENSPHGDQSAGDLPGKTPMP
ncbi:MAG: FAD-dependent oxidoreductase [Phycisphaerae bacterium]